MKSFQVISLLDPSSKCLDNDPGGEIDVLKTASVMEKLSRALESGQAQLDLELRELFGGEETDKDIKRHDQIEDEYLKVTGKPGV